MKSDFELFPIPEDSTLVPLDLEGDEYSLIVEALKINLNERDLRDIIKIRKILHYSEKFLSINKFFVQVAYCGIFQDQVKISMKQWFKKGKAPQLILAAQIDNENNIVNFCGVMTAIEFEEYLLKHDFSLKEITIPIVNFDGDLDLLFYYVQFLKISSIKRNGFIEKFKDENKNTENEEWNSWKSFISKNQIDQTNLDGFKKLINKFVNNLEKPITNNHQESSFDKDFYIFEQFNKSYEKSKNLNIDVNEILNAFYSIIITYFPPITNEEESQLVKQIQKGSYLKRLNRELNQDEKEVMRSFNPALYRIQSANLRLIYSEAHKFANQTWDVLSLSRYGLIGLEDAIYNYDQKSGLNFKKYIHEAITSSIKKTISTFKPQHVEVVRKICEQYEVQEKSRGDTLFPITDAFELIEKAFSLEDKDLSAQKYFWNYQLMNDASFASIDYVIFYLDNQNVVKSDFSEINGTLKYFTEILNFEILMSTKNKNLSDKKI